MERAKQGTILRVLPSATNSKGTSSSFYRMAIQAKTPPLLVALEGKLELSPLAIPPRSGDINCVENIFHIVKQMFKFDAYRGDITVERFDEFCQRVKTTMHRLDNKLIDRTINSMSHRMHSIIGNKGQHTMY